MDRAEKRRQEREEARKKATYTLTREQIDKIKEEATEDAITTAFGLMIAFPVMVLHDKYSKLIKKETRLNNFVDELLELYDSYDKGYFTIEDLNEAIFEETGVDLVDRRKKGFKI